MSSNMVYWLKGQPIQNFGDYLSEYFRSRLFYGEGLSAPNIRLIGSCIDDGLLQTPGSGDADDGPAPQAGRGTKIIFWGCGLRRPDGLSERNRPVVEILSVRGPLTRSALRLGNLVPVGDPGLLLPALYDPQPSPSAHGTAILTPHFHDQRSDEELLKLSGCDLVLRPNIANELESVEHFIDQLVSARFVLTGSLHAAVAAAAYRRPFGFWESGNIDLPFKWQDFAASLSIPCEFFAEVKSAQQHYESAIFPALKLPVLWPTLSMAPYSVRAGAFARVIRRDVESHGISVLEERASLALENRLDAEQAGRARLTRRLCSEAREHNARIEQLVLTLAEKDGVLQQKGSSFATLEAGLRHLQADRDKLLVARDTLQVERNDLQQSIEQLVLTLAEKDGVLQQKESSFATLEADLRHLQADRDKLLVARDTLQVERNGLQQSYDAATGELAILRANVEAQSSEIAGLSSILDVQRAAEDGLRKNIDQIVSSKSWRLTAPLRNVTLRHPKLGRNLLRVGKLAWWGLTGQLFAKLKTKRELRRQISLLNKSELFDKKWYGQQHPEVADAGADAAEHFFWIGAPANFDPHPLFDTSWYCQRYPEVASSGMNPLVHYLRVGAAAGYDPHPLFDSAWYCSEHPEVKESGVKPLIHYLGSGSKAGFDPNPWFDNEKYAIEYGEAAAGFDGSPLLHYVLAGSAQKLDPHPLFDARWYSSQHRDQVGDLDPLTHYLTAGIDLGFAPSPLLLGLGQLSAPPELAFTACTTPDVSIIIPVYKQCFYTYRCLYSILLRTGPDVKYEVIVADDCPGHILGKSLLKVPGLRVVQNATNLGFVRSCNNASKVSTAKYIVFLNSDTIAGSDWLSALVRVAEGDSSVAMVGGKLLNPDGTIQEAGGIILNDGWGQPYGTGDRADRGQYNYIRNVDCLTGACILVRRSQFEEAGRFDEAFAPAFYEEYDLAFAFEEKGYRIVYQPAAEIVHFGSQSYGAVTRNTLSLKNHDIFVTKWAGRLSTQPDSQQHLFLARDRSRYRGTILLIDDGLPQWDKHAGALTVYQYLKLLVEMEYRVIFCGVNLEPLQPYASALQQLGIELITKPDTLEAWLEQNGRYLDCVWTARPDVSGHLIPVLRAHTNARVIYYTHDLHYLREQRRYKLEGDPWALQESNRLKTIEFEIFRSVDCVMTPSCEEVKVIREAVPSANVREVLPYFFPPEPVTSNHGFSGRKEMVFVGGFGHTPNVDAAIWLVGEILPLVWKQAPDARLLIIGSNPPNAVKALAGHRVKVVGYVPEIEPYYARARISVNPLRYGAGVKGKIVASLRAGVPVVTTPIGNEGIGLRDGIDGFVAEPPAELAERIVTLYRDDDLCSKFSESGRSLIQQRFSAAKARQVLSEILTLDAADMCGRDVPQPHFTS